MAPRIGLEVHALRPGTVEELPDPGDGGLGMLVVEGILALEIDVPGSATADLLMPGDVLQAVSPSVTTVAHDRRLTALTQSSVALLDARIALLALRSPGVAAELIARVERRADAAGLRFASSHLPRIEDRIEALLLQVADRLGKVRPDGIHVELPVNERMLARLVGARLRSLNGALRRLAQERRVMRPEPGVWVLPRAMLAVIDRERAERPAA